MTIKEAVTTVFKKYATFSGRARRSEYWYWVLFTSVVAGVLSALASATGHDGEPGGFFNLLASLFSLAILVPNLAVAWRRLHDIGKKGSWYFIVFIPIVGWIWLIVLLCKDSQPGDNEYGPNPKETTYTY